MPTETRIRNADEKDIYIISEILRPYAENKLLLSRSPEDILSHLKNFCVALIGDKIAGCCALRNYGNNLFEVRSLAVSSKFSNMGIGTKLVTFCIEKAARNGKVKVFALTYRSEFFERLGFRKVQKSLFPEKIWSDCSVCSKKGNCDEDALLIEIG